MDERPANIGDDATYYPPKAGKPSPYPAKIVAVHDNGTVDLDVDQGAGITTRLTAVFINRNQGAGTGGFCRLGATEPAGASK